MVIFERYYEDKQASTLHGKKKLSTKRVLAVEFMALPGKVGMIPDKRGYYFRGDFLVLLDNTDNVVEVIPQLHGKFAKNNNHSSGWYWYWHEGSLRSMSVFIEKLDGYRPISISHYRELKSIIDIVEDLESKCTK